ncbi:hypothetical protein BKA56DRAFT_81878 [Ilyonectria sp. MPI-CAGE-AT-0026]|nr:hypothetical protein BKA56DRAFT_81878 [Ilyonectria sp. MPI-CAGE-AT-0026]
MPNWTEDQISAAIADVKAGYSVRKAAERQLVSRNTLSARLSGRLPKPLAFEHLQQLTNQQELHLIKWILSQDTYGLALTHR